MQFTLDTIIVLVLKGVVLPVVSAALAWASVKLPAWITAHVKNARVAGVLTRIEQLAMVVAQEVDQTVVSNLGDNATADQLKAARDAALVTLKSHLGDKGLQEIEQVLGLQDQDAVIRLLISFIESSVHTLKLAGKVST